MKERIAFLNEKGEVEEARMELPPMTSPGRYDDVKFYMDEGNTIARQDEVDRAEEA